ncbi:MULTISPECIES: hypothetical protein [Acinetobacter]|uniref:hypothetical protein n=1 Tax=Acinetobacter pseudolwoffii TaxID=2053287 RepID=UPI002090C303|nr:hypothetical protein [Acinetobacter pseudolwoffii]
MESIIAIFAWLNDVLLKMTWLSEGVRWLVENVFGLSVVTRLGGSIHFFIYDVFKIFILLSVLIYACRISRVIFRLNAPGRFWDA